MTFATIRYIGKADILEHHTGIPARDLTRDEYDALDAEQRKLVRTSPLYDYAAYHEATSVTQDEPAKESPAKKDDAKK